MISDGPQGYLNLTKAPREKVEQFAFHIYLLMREMEDLAERLRDDLDVALSRWPQDVQSEIKAMLEKSRAEQRALWGELDAANRRRFGDAYISPAELLQ
jgi:hypothetical protein